MADLLSQEGADLLEPVPEGPRDLILNLKKSIVMDVFQREGNLLDIANLAR